MPFAFVGKPRRWIRRVPPLYGQHTGEVLTGVLGRTEQDLVALRDSGVTSDAAGGLVKHEESVTLCVPPRPGELCAPVRFLVRQDSVVMELTARHRITSVEWDAAERAVAMVVEITDPQTARPVDVRIDVLEAGAAQPSAPRI